MWNFPWWKRNYVQDAGVWTQRLNLCVKSTKVSLCFFFKFVHTVNKVEKPKWNAAFWSVNMLETNSFVNGILRSSGVSQNTLIRSQWLETLYCFQLIALSNQFKSTHSKNVSFSELQTNNAMQRTVQAMCIYPCCVEEIKMYWNWSSWTLNSLIDLEANRKK